MLHALLRWKNKLWNSTDLEWFANLIVAMLRLTIDKQTNDQTKLLTKTTLHGADVNGRNVKELWFSAKDAKYREMTRQFVVKVTTTTHVAAANEWKSFVPTMLLFHSARNYWCSCFKRQKLWQTSPRHKIRVDLVVLCIHNAKINQIHKDLSFSFVFHTQNDSGWGVCCVAEMRGWQSWGSGWVWNRFRVIASENNSIILRVTSPRWLHSGCIAFAWTDPRGCNLTWLQWGLTGPQASVDALIANPG